MSRLLAATALLLLLLYLVREIKHAAADMAVEWEDKNFFKSCPPHKCSEDGPEIRYPFRLQSSNTSSSCGAPGMTLACSGQDTILEYQPLGRYRVTAIDYSHSILTIVPLVESSFPCPLHLLLSKSIPPGTNMYCECCATLVACSSELIPSIPAAGYISSADSIAGPIPCLSNATNLYYLVSGYLPTYALPLDCQAVSGGAIPIPCSYRMLGSFKERAESFLASAKTTLSWAQWESIRCQECESHGRRCAFSSRSNGTFCMPSHHGSRVRIIAATSSVTAILLMVATALYLSLKRRYNEEIHLKVEMFLKAYGRSVPTRYTFSEVKKIAKRFKHKIGQGGFGSVYRGELPNGVPVAVKMLEHSTGEGQEFINEVATIGRIHHANIVRLLGFCSEGTRRALIYEFMPNESLERYIFSHGHNVSKKLLVPSEMIDVALGIARGMEYLHQGCNQRILHFDIKPHNILLDYGFNPKISDFGLAKLCARDQSIVTLTAARGTMGYIAPELYSRNFGEISYKSDVYSFGMLVLEMVSGRRNSDPSIESQNELYLPEWIFGRVISGQDLETCTEMTKEEKEKVRQLAIVALWCIQWNPKNRPSTTKVVNMLTGRLDNLQMPPKPFVSSESHPMP